MEYLPKNGQFVQRRKMFVQAPFHNMKSYLPLNWQAKEITSQELQRARLKQIQQHEKVKKVYNQRVEKRLQMRYSPNGDYSNSTLENDLGNSRNEDILSREVEMFNSSKVVPMQSPRSKMQNRQNNQQYHTIDQVPQHQDIKIRTSHNSPSSSRENHQVQDRHNSSQRGQMYDDYLASNPESNRKRQGFLLPRQRNNEPVYQNNNIGGSSRSRYNSLQGSYPQRQLGKLVEQLYSGTKVQQYPFRNVIPDKLETHLRQKTKADRKRAYEVSLNLFKY